MAESKVTAHLSSDFWKFWTGQTVSNLGSSFSQFALPLLVYKLTGSALNLGITTAVEMLPYLFFGLLIGAWVDRVDRKRLMIWTDIVRALLTALYPPPRRAAPADRVVDLWAGLHPLDLTIFFTSGEFAAIPSLVEGDDLVTANGRIQASYSAATVVGPLLAGVLVAVMPLRWSCSSTPPRSSSPPSRCSSSRGASMSRRATGVE